MIFLATRRKQRSAAAVLAVLLASTPAVLAPTALGQAAPAAPAAKRMPIFIDPARFTPQLLVAPPPTADTTKSELAELHAIQSARTPTQLQRALADDKDESIFLYADVLGSQFKAESLPVTAELGRSIRNDAEIVVNGAKTYFGRLRPYAVDATIVGCPYDPKKDTRSSYPSGHAMNGYAYGFVLAAMLPDRAPAIMARARAYADDRLVCGLHYRSDVEASAVLAASLARDLLANADFQMKLDAARSELAKSGLVGN